MESEVVVEDDERPLLGLEGREGVVGDLRTRRRQRAEQRALARVREADESDVGTYDFQSIPLKSLVVGRPVYMDLYLPVPVARSNQVSMTRIVEAFEAEGADAWYEEGAKERLLGNVVNPDDIVASHGADTLRLYEMFMGPLDASIAWSENGLDGARRFLDRIWRLFMNEDGTVSNKIVDSNDGTLEKVYHQTVKKVTEDYEGIGFNKAIF